MYCPYHHNDNTPAGEVDKESGLFYCFGCQSTTDLLHLVMKSSGLNYFKALRLIGDSDYNIVEVVNKNLAVEEIEPFDQSVIDKLHSQIWGEGSVYLSSRGISSKSITLYELGYSNNQRMVTVPIHTATGTCAGFVGRSIEGKRFKNNRGLQKSQLLFNLHRVWTSPRVYVAESSFDVIRLGQVEVPAVATLGSGISTIQCDLLRRSFDEIIIIPDRDKAGETMTNKLLEAIPYIEVLELPDHAHDIGDLTDDELRGILE